MSNARARAALRGAEAQILDLIAEGSTSEQWAALLRGPLELAAGQGNGGLARSLVEAGAQIGDALHAAVGGGHVEVVHNLLDNGASVDAKHTVFGSFGSTPLHVAAREGKPEMARLLMLNGASTDILHTRNRLTPLYTAALFRQAGVALALMDGGADVNLRCGRLESPVIHAAAQVGYVDILRAAIEHGADVNACSLRGRRFTAIHIAAQYNNAEAIGVLVEAGASLEARCSDGSTPLCVAVGDLSLGASTALLQLGAHVNAQTNLRQTPLFYAVRMAGLPGATGVVDLLLRSGADETLVDRDGKAAADFVARDVDEEARLAEDVERVRKLLASAPSDRVWRRRGYLVLCRSHPHRVILPTQESGRAHAGTGWETHGAAKLARTDKNCSDATVGGSSAYGRGGAEWARVVARVLGLQEEGIFRKIVGYL